MTFYEAAIEVLRRTGRPLHFKKITEFAIRDNLLSHVGKTPDVTMSARLNREVKREDLSWLVKTRPGVFTLRDEMLDQINKEAEAREEEEKSRKAEEEQQSAKQREYPEDPELFDTNDADDEESNDEDSDDRRGRGRGRGRGRRRGRGRGRGRSRGRNNNDSDNNSDNSDSNNSNDSEESSSDSNEESRSSRSNGRSRSRGGRGGRGRNRNSSRDQDSNSSDDRNDRNGSSSNESDEDRSSSRSSRSSSSSRRSNGRSSDDDSNNNRSSSRRQRSNGRSQKRDDVDLSDVDQKHLERGPVRLDGIAEAAYTVLQDQKQSPTAIKRLSEEIFERKLIRFHTHDAAMTVQAAMVSDNQLRARRGHRPLFVRFANSRWGLSEWGLTSAALSAEQQILSLSEDCRQEALRQLGRALLDVKPEALEQVTLTMLEGRGYRNIKVSKRSSNGDVFFSADWRQGLSDVRVCIQLVGESNVELERDAVTDLRGTLHHYAASEGVIIHFGDITEDAIEESREAKLAPMTLIDRKTFVELLVEQGIGVRHFHTPILMVDTGFIDELTTN